MRKFVAIALAVVCILGLTACSGSNNRNVLHLGINASIQFIDVDAKQITVNGLDENSFLGEGCVIACGDVPMVYCNYSTGDTKNIQITDLQVGDEVILGVRESDILRYNNEPTILVIEQLQLGSQRLND